jgi:hypothetical protein
MATEKKGQILNEKDTCREKSGLVNIIKFEIQPDKNSKQQKTPHGGGVFILLCNR